MKTLAVERLTTMNPFTALHLWTQAFQESFAAINSYETPDNVVLDAAGGDGWLGSIANEPGKYYLIDLDQGNVDRFEGENKICGSVEEMPYENEKFNVIISQSTL